MNPSLDALAATATERTHLSQADVAHRIRVFFGDRVADPTVTRWTTAHTDLHWANLMAPQCALVDWEGLGIASAGFDAATVSLHSLLGLEMAVRVRVETADLLATRAGLLVQLYLTRRMMLRINSGDYFQSRDFVASQRRPGDQRARALLVVGEQVAQELLRRGRNSRVRRTGSAWS